MTQQISEDLQARVQEQGERIVRVESGLQEIIGRMDRMERLFEAFQQEVRAEFRGLRELMEAEHRSIRETMEAEHRSIRETMEAEHRSIRETMEAGNRSIRETMEAGSQSIRETMETMDDGIGAPEHPGRSGFVQEHDVCVVFLAWVTVIQ